MMADAKTADAPLTVGDIEAACERLFAECERLGIPVRYAPRFADRVITATGLATLLDYGPDTIRKWRDGDGGQWHEGDPGPRYRIASWRGHRYTYGLADLAMWLSAKEGG